MGWIIVNTIDPELCWSSTADWQVDDYDTFTEDERERFALPLDGEWQEVPWRPH